MSSIMGMLSGERTPPPGRRPCWAHDRVGGCLDGSDTAPQAPREAPLHESRSTDHTPDPGALSGPVPALWVEDSRSTVLTLGSRRCATEVLAQSRLTRRNRPWASSFNPCRIRLMRGLSSSVSPVAFHSSISRQLMNLARSRRSSSERRRIISARTRGRSLRTDRDATAFMRFSLTAFVGLVLGL